MDNFLYHSEHDTCDCHTRAHIDLSHQPHSAHKQEPPHKELWWLGIGVLVMAAGILFEYILDFGPTGAVIAFVLFMLAYFWLGWRVLLKMVKNIIKGKIFDENFLMGIATVGAIILNMPLEAVTVMLFYQIGEFLQERAVAKSKRQITDLMDIRPDTANILIDGVETKVDPATLGIGALFLVKPGERIPLDGVVRNGHAQLDTSALTGESVPRTVHEGDAVLSGCINQNGVLTIEATQTFRESTASRILDLVAHAAEKKAPTETFITKFARYYTPTVVIFAALLAIIPPLFFQGSWQDWISRALIFLVISCPCALVVSIPLGFMGGIGGASKRGILVKGGNYLEALANCDMVVFDKTGTLTQAVFQVVDINPAHGFTKKELMHYAAYAETFSNHPIALSILKAYSEAVDTSVVADYKEIAGHGVQAMVDGKFVKAGNKKFIDPENINQDNISNTAQTKQNKVTEATGTKVYVRIADVYAGCITIADEIKPAAESSVSQLKHQGISKTVMLTGDTLDIAQAVAAHIGIDEVHAGLLPQDKVAEVERLMGLKKSKKTLAFVGDGINDAPVLAMADIGVAMGALGSDAAIEAADVVLMTDELGKLNDAIDIARFTKRVVWQNIIMSLGIKVLFLFLATLGVSSLWEAVFADVGVSLLAVLNSMRIMKRA